MSWRPPMLFGMLLAASATVSAQTNSANLPAFLSAVQSIASELNPKTTSSSSSSTSSKSSTSSSTTAPTTSTNSPSAAASALASSTPSAIASNAVSGIDSQTRNIILGVTIPIGLIILAIILVLLFICCRRRRRRSSRGPSPESKYAGGHDWERGDTTHHGHISDSNLRTGHDNDLGHVGRHETVPFVAAAASAGPSMSEHPAYRNSSGNPNAENPFTPTPPISRKPVPGRNSTGSNLAGINDNHHDGHHSALGAGAAVGTGALAGAAVMHHHEKHRRSDASQNRPESWHRPLGSHPHESPMYATTGATNNHHHEPPMYAATGATNNHHHELPMYAAAGATNNHHHELPMYAAAGAINHHHSHDQKRDSVPFSPDDVGSTHRSSGRYSQGSNGLNNVSQPPITNEPQGTIIAPTASQRRSLQSRHSGDGKDTPRGPSRSPKRRSLTGGGEIWQADNASTRSASNSIPYSNGDTRRVPAVVAPALPSNRNSMRARVTHAGDSTTDSSTSNDSWESAQTELNPWNDRDTGRYPRFSGGSMNSNAPLMPPSATWDDKRERRWSGDMLNRSNGNANRFYPPEARRNSGGMDRRKLRFSEGEPEYYNEQGLVGRAL